MATYPVNNRLGSRYGKAHQSSTLLGDGMPSFEIGRPFRSGIILGKDLLLLAMEIQGMVGAHKADLTVWVRGVRFFLMKITPSSNWGRFFPWRGNSI